MTARNVGPTDESTSLSGPGSEGCLVQSWSAKPQRYAHPRRPDRVQIHDQSAAYGNLDPDYGPYPRAVVWHDTQDRWFSVSCDLDRAGILHLAERVRTQHSPMRVPFRLTAMPAGATMEQLIESREGDHRIISAQFDMAGPAGPWRPLTMQISNVPDRSLLQGPAERRQLNGRDVEVRTASQTICLVTGSDPICVSGPGDEPATGWSTPDALRTAEQTAERLVAVDDLTDYSTWYDADDAFPS